MNILTPLLMASGLQLAIFGILGLAVLVFVLVFISYIGLFVKSLLAGATVGFPTLVAMRLRGVPILMGIKIIQKATKPRIIF